MVVLAKGVSTPNKPPKVCEKVVLPGYTCFKSSIAMAILAILTAAATVELRYQDGAMHCVFCKFCGPSRLSKFVTASKQFKQGTLKLHIYDMKHANCRDRLGLHIP